MRCISTDEVAGNSYPSSMPRAASLALPSKGHGYHLITCTYPKTLPRILIGADLALGPLALISNAVRGMVLHQTPNWCSTVPYTNGEEGAS